MSHASCPSNSIEQIDLTGDPNPGVFQKQKNSHFDVQLYVLNHQQSLKNLTTVWHRNADGSFHATEQLNPSIYHQDRIPYLDRDGQVDEQWANQKWQQWSERDFHPAVEAFTEYNESSPELLVLESAKESISRGEDAVKDIWAEISCAQKTLDLAVLAPNSRDPEILSAAMRIIFKDLAIYLRRIERAQKESKEQLESLGLAVRSLIRSKTISEKSERKRQAKDERVLDTVKFVKECLDNHSRLVDIVLGRPEPLVQEGTDIMQAMLSEMFGLPVPTMQEPAEEYMQQTMGGALEEVELEQESESEIEYLWGSSQPQDLMDIEAEESSGTESDDYNDDSTGEELNEYDDSMSEYSNYSATFVNKSEKALRKEKRDRTRKARKELWSRFGLTVEDTEGEDQEDAPEEDRGPMKRQKLNSIASEDKSSESRLTTGSKPHVLRQVTLNFDKFSKSRRLFSRTGLNQKGVFDEQEKEKEEADEKAVVASSGSIHRNSKRNVGVPPGYRYQQPKPISPGGRLLARRRTGR